MIDLRPGQDKVAQYRGGLMAVPAVPGAGKTFTLAYLASDLIAQNYTGSGKILIVTYMNSAVANFRRRINQFLEEKGLPRNRGYEVKTLHSLAMNILKERPDYLLINDDFNVIDDSERWGIISQLAEGWISENPKRWKKMLSKRNKEDKWLKEIPRTISRLISYLKQRGMSQEHIRKIKKAANDSSYLAWGLELLEEYSSILYQNGWLDFDDLIINAWRLLNEDENLCNRLRKKWTYIFEDEAQDSNPIQEEILKLLAGDDGNLVRVGDSNQAIMGTFTSAEPEIFRRFCSADSVLEESILYSSRSTERVIGVANHLVDWATKKHPNPKCRTALEEQMIYPVGKEENPNSKGTEIVAKVLATEKKEREWVVQEVKRRFRDFPNETIAILVPNRYLREEMMAALAKAKIPAQEIGKISKEQSYTIDTLKYALKYLAKPHQKDNFIKLFKGVFLIDFKKEELAVLDELFNSYSLEEVIYPIGGEFPSTKLPDELLGNRKLYRVYNEALEMIREWLEASVKLPPDELALFIIEHLELEGDILALAQGIVLQIRDQLKFNPDWKLVDIVEQIFELELSFKQIAKKFNSLRGFEAEKGVVSVLTAHKSKGLEWDSVFVTSLVHDKYPVTLRDYFRGELNYLDYKSQNPIANAKAELNQILGRKEINNPDQEANIEVAKERLRLIYVAITRAEKNLFLSAYKKRYFKEYEFNIRPNEAFVQLQRYLKT